MSLLRLLHQSTTNMSRVSKFLSLAAITFAAVSCGGSNENAPQVANIDGILTAAPSSEVVLGKLDINQMVVLDTLTTDEVGYFSYEVEVAKGNPEFVYVYSQGHKVASLLVDAGDKVSFTVDAEGVADIQGSEESVKLMQVEIEHAQMSAMFADLAAQLEKATGKKANEITAKFTEEYKKYNRSSVKYVMENPYSMTTIPVLYRSIGSLPVFAMHTDAVLFNTVADSLETVYPDSKYVKSLRADATSRFEDLKLMGRLSEAEEIGYFDIELPGLDGQKRKLSEVDSKVILLYFWTASDPQQNMFNNDVLKRLYKDYHHKGFDIFQVSLDTDKVMWATTVMSQDLPWTNVCDIRGAASEYARLYNLQILPSLFVISNGELVDGKAVDEASFRKLLNGLLK